MQTSFPTGLDAPQLSSHNVLCPDSPRFIVLVFPSFVISSELLDGGKGLSSESHQSPDAHWATHASTLQTFINQPLITELWARPKVHMQPQPFKLYSLMGDRDVENEHSVIKHSRCYNRSCMGTRVTKGEWSFLPGGCFEKG